MACAAAEICDQLGDGDGESDGRSARRRERSVARAEWEAHAAADAPGAAALRGALDRIDTLERELGDCHDLAYDRRVIRANTASPAERDEATARSRARSARHLADHGIEGAERRWSDNAFGSLEDHGLGAPLLVLAAHASPERPSHVDHRFGGDRRWIALSHRFSDGIGSGEVDAIATPLETTMDVHRRLGQLTRTASRRADEIGHLVAYQGTVAELFGDDVTVGRQRGPVGGGVWPFDLDSLPALTGLDTAALADMTTPVDEGFRFLSFGPHWQLLLLGDPSDDDHFL